MPSRNDQTERFGVPISKNHEMVQQMLSASNAAIGQQRQAGMGALSSVERDMYSILGQQQLQTERDISQRRMMALRSGQTSAQLAAQELQNIQTIALGAQQTAQQYDMQRQELMREFAGAESMNEAAILEMLNQNRVQTAAIEAERLANDMGAFIENLVGTEAYEQLSAEDRMTISLVQQGVLDADSEGFKRAMASLQQRESILSVRESISERFGEDSNIVNPNANILSINSSPGEFGNFAGKDTGRQGDWIRTVQEGVRTGAIQDGDVVDVNYGIGISNYLIVDGHFVKISDGTVSNLRKKEIQTHFGRAPVIHKQGRTTSSGIGS